MTKEEDAEKKLARDQAIAKMEEARTRQKKKDAAAAGQSAGSAGAVPTTMPEDASKVKETTSASKENKNDSKQPLDLSELHRVRVYSPFRVYFDGEADSVSAVNGTGPFDVLPGHKNFLSLLQPCTLIVRNKRRQEEMKIDRGVMHVKDNNVTIFLDV